MKIKTVKKMNLPELIQYVWENEEGSTNRYISHKGKTVTVDNSGVEFSSKDNGIVLKDVTFTVEVEEELKMITKIPLIVHMYIDSDGVERSENCYNQSIIECQFPTQSEEISLTMYSASGGDLTFIWNGRNGIPESGVLEVDVE